MNCPFQVPGTSKLPKLRPHSAPRRRPWGTALCETALAGLPSLLTSVLLQTESTLRIPVLQNPAAAAALPSNFVPVAAAVLRLLNATARFGPEVGLCRLTLSNRR